MKTCCKIIAMLASFSFLSPSSMAQQNSFDRFFVVDSAVSRGLDFFDTPAVNDLGDIAVKVTTGTTKAIYVYLGSEQIVAAPAPAEVVPIQVRSSTGNLNAFPKINNRKSVVSLNFQSGQFVLDRYDYSASPSPTFAAVRIARGNSSQTLPFQFISGLADIDDSVPAKVYFYAERQPLSGPYNYRIYGSTTDVTTPASAPFYASRPDAFTELDFYVGASGNGNIVYRGNGPNGLGLYTNQSGSGSMPVAGTVTGFSVVGQNPAINNSNTVAFYGEFGAASAPQGIYLRLAGESVPRRAGNMALASSETGVTLVPSGVLPQLYYPNERVSLNDFNQVAFVGIDDSLQGAIFTSAMGSLRKLISVGSKIAFNNATSSVTFVRIFDGLGTNGQVTFLAGLDSGDNLVLRAGRGFTQTKLKDSPIVPSYQDTFYLLRSVAGSGWPMTHRIKNKGCNFVSTVNLMNFYGIEVSPADYHRWLTNNWKNPPDSHKKSDYISASNDIVEPVIQDFTVELFRQGLGKKLITYVGIHKRANGPNLSKIIAELRSGRAVKLRVPNGSPPFNNDYWIKTNRVGHYILAYGLKNPSQPDSALTNEDILIMDPGNGGIYTLGAYGKKTAALGETYDGFAGNWLEDGDDRVYLYRPSTTVSPEEVLQFILTFGPTSAISAKVAPGSSSHGIEAVLQDEAGRRLGVDPAVGEWNEIPGGDYATEQTYYGLDEDANDPAWKYPLQKVITLHGATNGIYSIDVIGGTSGEYTLTAVALGGIRTSFQTSSGLIAAGQRLSFQIPVTDAPPVIHPPLKLANGDFQIEVKSAQGRNISLESSPDLTNWITFSSILNTNGSVIFIYPSTNSSPQQFFRAR